MSRRDVKLQMADGIELAATLWFPQGDGPWPALLEALPYRKDDDTAAYMTEYVRLAEAGYVMCRVDVRGTGSSQGIPTDEYPAEERTDMCEVIRWLATQDWSTGAVGMYGTSYSGFNSIQIAMERPPELRAIIPIFATDDRYRDDVHYFGGALKQLDLVDYPTYMIALNALPPVPSVYGDGWEQEWERRLRSSEPWLVTWLEHQRRDEYWKFGSLDEDYGAIEVPTMIVAGWADGYTNNSLRTMEALRCPKRLLLGPWAHASLERSDPGPNIDIVPEMLRWFDRWLKDEDNGVDREPQIVLFARRSTKIAPLTDNIEGEWRFEPEWPAKRLTPTAFELVKASSAPEGEGPDTVHVRGDVGWTGWISCAGHLPWGQPADQRPDEAYSLVYDWDALTDELDVFGHPVLEVTVTSSAPIAQLSAKLCDVFPDGYSALVTRGLLNLSHRDSDEELKPLEPGVPMRVRLELEVTSWTFEAGHRVRLDIAGSDFPNTWPPPEALDLTIDRSDATLTLPVMDGPTPVTERPELAAPRPVAAARAEGTESPANRGSDGYAWRIEHDVPSGETRAVVGNWGDYSASEHIPSYSENYSGTVAVVPEQPARARAEGDARFELRFPEANVVSETHTRITSDRDNYRLTIDLKVSKDGHENFSRNWDRTIPRDLQ